MIKQFQISNYVQKQIIEYLAAKNTGLAAAMNDETMNKEIAAILHGDFPAMLKKFYPLAKFETFFWEKRDFLLNHIQNRLGLASEPEAKQPEQ